MSEAIIEIARQFSLDGPPVQARPFGSGHIHDTYKIVCEGARGQEAYILQRINRNVFRKPEAVMDNIQRVTLHLRKKLEEKILSTQIRRETLSLAPARGGEAFYRDPEGECWRVYRFIGQSKTYDTPEAPELVFEAARMFGEFLHDLADLPADSLHETIPDFHNTPLRLEAFRRSVAADSLKRCSEAKEEIRFAMDHCGIANGLERLAREERVPRRVAHNDTKINNVLLDALTGRGLCVIDLDTVMPGLALYDFGDMIRTMTCPAEEDTRDLNSVAVRLDLFEALVKGYLTGAGDSLTNDERGALVLAGKIICFEQGLRFLTDYLSGDPYYRIHRPGHNLDRCRTQFKLLESLTAREKQMESIVQKTHGLISACLLQQDKQEG